ncbi:MAG: metallophosphoesterase [Prevotella sp.]|nr:metallophosphoesterase [Prevotella sp.]MCM1075653.1 metallophosphoesterase [Ruminococcus sp.]
MRLPLIFTLILLIPALLTDAYIYFRIPKQQIIKGRSFRGRRWYLCGAVITNLLLVLCMCWPKRDADASLLPVMWVLYTWATIYIPKFIYVIVDLIGRIPHIFRQKYLPLGKFIGLPVGIVVFIAMWWGAFFGRTQIMVNEVEISSPKVPESFDGFRIVQFSDAHVGTWGDNVGYIQKLTNRINELKPDLIVFTGDLVNRRSDEAFPFVEILSSLKAKYGVYTIMGNHDYGDYSDWPSEEAHKADRINLKRIQEQMGWKTLDNSHEFIHVGKDSIALIGVENWGEPPFKQYGNLDAAYPHNRQGKIKDDNFKILLTHNPMHWHEYVRYNTDIDLSLSGHTHAMQIMFGKPGSGFSPAAWKYPEWGGLYEYLSPEGDKLQLYVNIGCGEVGVPMRIGATPEITVFTLRHE